MGRANAYICDECGTTRIGTPGTNRWWDVFEDAGIGVHFGDSPHGPGSRGYPPKSLWGELRAEDCIAVAEEWSVGS